jgi:hypothetical protein
MPRHWTPRATSDRTLNAFARSLLQSIDDSKLVQEATHNIYSGESQSTIEHFHPYGFTASPQPAKDGKGAESIIAFLDAARDHGVAIVTADRRYRPQKFKAGEVALHDDQTQQLHLARDGSYHSIPNDKKHSTRIMRKGDSVKGKQGGSGGAGAAVGANDQFGQQAWQPKTPYAHHSMDKDTRTVQHPGKIAHQVTDTNDQSTVIHESWLDQLKGIFHGVQKGLHSISISTLGGIVHSVQNGLHSISLLNGINLKSGSSITAIATQAISHLAPSVNIKGITSITGNLGVSGLSSFGGLASFAGGLGTGALEVAPDSAGGLVQATKGFAVVQGLTTDTQIFSPTLPNWPDDATAATHGIAIGQLYQNSGVVRIRVT